MEEGLGKNVNSNNDALEARFRLGHIFHGLPPTGTVRGDIERNGSNMMYILKVIK